MSNLQPNTDSTKRNRPGITYVCTERIIDSRLLIYNKMFLEILLKKIRVHIFTLLLAPFTPKLVYYSSHSESMKYV